MNKRRPEATKLRYYVDAIKQAKATTDDEWIAQWIHSGDPWVSRTDWIKVLESWALAEAMLLVEDERKVA